MTTAFRPPVNPCFQGEQVLASLGATMVLGRDYAIEEVRAQVRRGVPMACDIETDGLGALARNIKCVIYSPYPHGDRAVILDPRDRYQWEAILWAMDNAPGLVFHNSGYDVPNLVINGLFKARHAAKVTDTLLYARQAEPDNLVKKKLSACAERYLGLAYDKDGMKVSANAVGIRSEKEMYRQFDLDRPIYARGAAVDAIVTARIVEPVRQAVIRRFTDHPFPQWGVEGQEAVDLMEREQKLNRMSLRRTAKGFKADLGYLDDYNAKFAVQLDQTAQLISDVGIRPTNSQDLVKTMDKLELIPGDYPRTKKTGLLSGKKDDLAKLNHPLARTFVWHKEHLKTLNDYLLKVRDLAVEDIHGDMRLYPVVNWLMATTGRQSIGGPPVHQFPPGARGVITFEEGGGTSIDWSQIEPVTIANIAGDLKVLSGYEDGSSDLYSVLGLMAGIPRKGAKTQTLGTLYGQGLSLTASKLGVDIPRALEIKDAVFGAMPKVYELTKTLRQLGEDYRLVPTVSGRMIPIPMSFFEGRQSVATHKAVNYFVQGSAYDILAEALLRVEMAGLGDYVYFSMHDEILVATEAAEAIRAIMETPPPRLILHSGRTPVLRTDMLELGDRWAAA